MGAALVKWADNFLHVSTQLSAYMLGVVARTLDGLPRIDISLRTLIQTTDSILGVNLHKNLCGLRRDVEVWSEQYEVALLPGGSS